MEESRERWTIASIEAVVGFQAHKELETLGMNRSEMREWILETGYILAQREGLKTPLRRVDISHTGWERNGEHEPVLTADVYGTQPEGIRNIPVAW